LLLEDQNLIKLFKVGWKILYTDVSLYTALTLQTTLSGIAKRLKDKQKARKHMLIVSALEAIVYSGKPLLFSHKLGQLRDFLDGQTLDAIRPLLYELPALPAGINKRENSQKLPFIASIRQIHAIQSFLKHCVMAHFEKEMDP
jgi:hypothetical protein